MESRSPFHHHPQHPGYISLPPPPPPPPRPQPPNPHNRNLYHQPHRLPPPPPLPPGLHPLYHHPDFHHQQNPRKPHTPSFEYRDRNRPNRFNHHHHQYHEEQHVRREVWDHPTRQIHQQNHPIVVFDPQHEHRHREHLHHHQNRSTLVAIDRFEDLDDRDHSDLEVVQLPEGFEVEDLYLPPPDKGYQGNNSNSRNNNNVYYSNNPRNVLIDSGDFHIVSDERRVDYERKVASLGRNRSVSHNSIMEIENEGLGWEYEVRDDRVRNVSDKRARIGKYKDVVESEGYKEFVRPPHKKVQKPSALHRVQLEKDNYRNWKNDENEYFDDPNDGGFSNRGPIVFSDQRQEEVREYGGRGRSRLFPSQRQEQEREFSGKRPMGYSNPIQEEVREASSVELDVSFKSNTLVAKAIVSSSNQNPMVSGDGASTPNSKKRKAIVPLLSVSSPRVTAIRERPLNASKKKWNATSSFEKVLIQSKDKATYGTQSGVAVGSQSRPNVMSTRVPTEQSKPKAAHTITGNGVSVKSRPCRDGESISIPLQKSGVVKSPSSALIGSNKPCANKIKKKVVKKVKKKVVPVSVVKRAAVRPAVCSDGISIPKVGKMNGVLPSTNLSGSKITKPLNASSVVDDKNSDLSTDMGAGKSDGEGAVSSSGTKAGAGSQSLDGANAPHNDSATLKSPLNHVGSSGEMVHSCLSGFENSRELYQRPVNADNLNSDKDIKQSEEQVPSSGSDTKDSVHLQSLDSVIEPVKNTAAAVVESFQCPLVSSVDTPPVKKKSVMDRLSGFSSSRAIKERPINADGSARYVNPALSSDKGLRQFEQKSAPSGAHTVDNVGSQSLNGKTVAPEESEAVQSQFSPLVGSPGTSNIKKKKPKRKKKKFMNNLSGDSSSRVTDVNERSKKEGTVSVITTINAVALPVVTVPVEKSAAVKSFPKHGFGSPEKPKVEKKEKVTKVSVTSSSRVSAIHEKPANADGQTHGVGGALSLDRDLKQSEDEVTTSAMQTIDDDVSQFLHEVSLSLQKQSKVGSVSGSAIDSCAMDKINEKPFSGLSSLKPYEIHERMVNADSLVHGSDTPLTSDKDLSQSEAEVKASLIKDSAVRPSPIYLDDCVGTYAKINKKQNSITPPSSQLTKMSDEPLKSDTLNANMDICMDAVTSFDEGQKKSEIKAMVSGIGNLDDVCSQPLDWASVSQNSQQERPPAVTDVVRDGLDDGIVRSSMHSYVDPISIFEDSTSRDLLSRYMGLEDNQRDDSSFTMVTDSPMYVPLDETIEQESEVTREDQTDVYGAEEHGMLGQEDLEDVELHSQMQEESNNNSDLELYKPILNEKPPGELVKDGLPVISNPSSSVAKPLLSSLTNHNKEAMDSIPESHVTADPRQSSFTVPVVHIMNSEQSHCQLPSKKDGKGNRSNNESLDQTLHDHLNPEKLSLASKQSGQPISGLKPEVGVSSVKKAFQVTPVPKPLPGRAPFASGKGPDSVTHVTRLRTWRRMDNPFPLSQQESGLSTGPSQRQSPKKLGKIQSTSYVRKGNSLVRKYAPTANPNGSGVASTSLNHMVRDESRQSAVSGDKLNCVEPRNGSGTGVERSRGSPLPHNTSPPNGTTSFSQANTSSTSADLLAEDCSESTPDPACDKPENQDAGHSDQDGVSDKPETPSTLDSGKPKSSTVNGITYVKPKSNQLVVSCNTVGVSENIQPLHSSASYDQYYKKKNNQLIRNSPSLGSYLKLASSVLVDSSNAESQRDLKVSSMKCSRSPNKRRDKALVKNSSMVWTLNGTQKQNEDTNLLHRGKVFPHLFPWKRIAHWRNSISNLASVSQRSPFSLISKKLLLSRKRDTVYTRSTGGFSLRKAKVLSIGGSNLKWSKSIESRSKKANEEATLAVAAVEKKKRERKGAGCAIASAKNKSRSSCERIFRIGSVRYKMDPSKRTLQRIPDENLSSAVDAQSGKDLKRSFIPKRLLIGNDEYVRIGNGNQLVRDPKKLVRIMASEKVRWSLHTARLRMAKKQQYCQFFTRFGKCNKSNGKCPYIHDPDKIAVCTKFLKGSCSDTNCTLTHKVIPERMEDCSYFLQGLCTKEKCPYRHVNVNPNAPVCEGFLRGYCADGNECCKKHTYVCPQFESTGECPQRPMCKLRHPKNQNRSRKRKRSKDRKSVKGRYFGSRLIDSYQMGFISSDKHSNEQNEDIFSHEGRLTNYISLDASDTEIEDTDDPVTKFDDSELSDVQSDELDKLMKPLRLMNRTSS